MARSRLSMMSSRYVPAKYQHQRPAFWNIPTNFCAIARCRSSVAPEKPIPSIPKGSTTQWLGRCNTDQLMGLVLFGSHARQTGRHCPVTSIQQPVALADKANTTTPLHIRPATTMGARTQNRLAGDKIVPREF